MKLINAGHLIKWLKDTYCDISKQTWSYDHHVMASDMIEILNDYPATNDELPANWDYSFTEGVGNEMARCSNCGASYEWQEATEWYKYCPHCGAKMEVKE